MCREAKNELETLRHRLQKADARIQQLSADNAGLRERLGEPPGVAPYPSCQAAHEFPLSEIATFQSHSSTFGLLSRMPALAAQRTTVLASLHQPNFRCAARVSSRL